MKNYRMYAVLAALLLQPLGALAAPDTVDTIAAAEATTDSPSAASSLAETTDEETAYVAWAKTMWASLSPQTGDIELGDSGAKLHVPEDFYFLNSADAEKVLVEVWGNPPGQDVLGMLFPAESTPFDSDAWAVTVEFEDDGYVSDDDADSIDYDDMLKDMKSDVADNNKARIAQGFEAIELVGWASHPFYDKDSHKLHWAKEIKFGDAKENTLNYNIRVLGRKGVLVLNFIAGIDQKALIDEKLNSVLAMAEFDQGSTYGDFNPDLDKVAAYGLGALVAGKLIAKTGLIAMALIFLKKFAVIFLIAFASAGKWLFSRLKNKG